MKTAAYPSNVNNSSSAARISNAAHSIMEIGANQLKESALSTLAASCPSAVANHRACRCHLHDLEYSNITYNCIGMSVDTLIGEKHMTFAHALRCLYRKIVELSNMQSGGIGFINFDEDISKYLTETDDDESVIEQFCELMIDLNSCVRKGCEKAYVTFNIGLSSTKAGRRVCSSLLDAYAMGDDNGNPFVFPNIVYKVKQDTNKAPKTINYDLYKKALAITAYHMVPTYFNCDTEANKVADANKIGIMGCRTRVVNNLYGEDSSLLRGNVTCATMNLPQIASECEGNVDIFKTKIREVMLSTKDVLVERFNMLIKQDFYATRKHGWYLDADKSAHQMLRNGTLSIGFIGLWDAISVLTNHIIQDADDLRALYPVAKSIVDSMRECTDNFTQETRLNFSLLASAAEGVTGRFADYDYQHTSNHLLKETASKGYYSNSFHVPVDVSISSYEKIALESEFHSVCNGGCITYVEFSEMPASNAEAIQDMVDYAFEKGCNYFGINFPLDYCTTCGHTGRIGEICPGCGGHDIKRLRRVSGYLAESDRFTPGKYKEMLQRIGHDNSNSYSIEEL